MTARHPDPAERLASKLGRGLVSIRSRSPSATLLSLGLGAPVAAAVAASTLTVVGSRGGPGSAVAVLAGTTSVVATLVAGRYGWRLGRRDGSSGSS